MEYVSYEEFKKMDMRIGTIKEVESVPETDKLLKFQIDFGDTEEARGAEADGVGESGEGEEGSEKKVVPKFRQIVSGIHEFYPDYQKLVGKQVLYIVNLEPRTIKGVESHGMLMAVDGKDGAPVFLMPEQEVAAGSKIR
jgi:methionyl-tRNA synthetase